MKSFAKFLTVVTVLVLLALGYVVYASNLNVRFDSFSVVSCADQPEAFTNIRALAEQGTSDVTLYSGVPSYNAADYKFVTYQINVRNLNVIPAEWMDVMVESQEGDVLLVNAKASDLPAFNDTMLTVILLTDRGTVSLTRKAKLTYYVYGRYHEVEFTLKG